MKFTSHFLLLLLLALFSTGGMAQSKKHPKFRTSIPRDSIRLSDPCILADDATRTYYMTGTGGLLWKSKDLDKWDGPYIVAETDSTSWMGSNPQIWAAELHKYNGKYYYFATFTNNSTLIGNYRGNDIPRRACHVLVSDKPDGPYRPMKDPTYLPESVPTLDGTLWVDKDGKPYMVYCGEWLQNWNGTIEKIELKPDLSGTIGQAKVLFRASDSPWSRELVDGKGSFTVDGDITPAEYPVYVEFAGNDKYAPAAVNSSLTVSYGDIDLDISVSVDKETVNKGDNVTVTVVVKNNGDKERPGDNKTPVSWGNIVSIPSEYEGADVGIKSSEVPFRVEEICDASTWTHDFNDGKGVIEGAYGPWFISLDTGWDGIGIHGTHDPNSIGTNASEGCIRLLNKDIIELKEMISTDNGGIGTRVIITED